MSLIKAAKICFDCHKKYDIGKSKEVLDAVYFVGETNGLTILIKEAELKCLSCGGETPWLADAISAEYVAPIERKIKLIKKEKERERTGTIKRQEKREFHERTAPGKILELDPIRRSKG